MISLILCGRLVDHQSVCVECADTTLTLVPPLHQPALFEKTPPVGLARLRRALWRSCRRSPWTEPPV